MSRSLNKVTLIGNLGNDPEVRSTSGGNRMATFSLATSRTWNSTSGERQEKTEWHRCVAWNSKFSGSPYAGLASFRSDSRIQAMLTRGIEACPGNWHNS